MFPHVRTSGSAHERGRQYGAIAVAQVRRSIEAYAGVFAHYAGWDWETVSREAKRFIAPIDEFGPQYLEEMRGIAAGAGVAFLDVVAINVRTEVMYAAKARSAAAMLPHLECTSFAAVPDDGRPVLIGQNWDWKTHASDTTVVLASAPDDGPRFVTVVEAGLLAKTGLNEHGLGVATNALASDSDKGDPGVPYHVLLRALLAAESAPAALATLQRPVRSSSAHYLLAHRDGFALSVEALPGAFDQLYVLSPDDSGVLLHGKHLVHPRIPGVDVGLWLMPDSPFRLQRARQFLRQHDPHEASTYEQLLADHVGHPSGVCCHPLADAVPAQQDATIFSIVMNLESLSVRLTDGRPCEGLFRSLDSESFLCAGDVGMTGRGRPVT